MNYSELFRRALAADPAELVSRVGQMVGSRSQRVRHQFGLEYELVDGHLSSLGLTADEATKQTLGGRSNWFVTREKIAELTDHYRVHKIERALILNRADKLVSGKMPLFSREPVEFGGADRWRRDHILGVTAPQEFFGDIPYLDCTVVGDSKHLWEPNRFGWVYWLGPAYLLTGDEKYFRCFAELTADWFAQNPYPVGVNYSSALEVAFRSYAWVWALDFFRKPLLDYPDFVSEILRGVWVGCNHIEKNISRYFAPNTHLTGEAFALFACGAALPGFSESARWRQIGSEVLAEESQRQFYADGTHRELSSSYHLYSTDFYLQALLIAERCGVSIDSRIGECAESLSRRLIELAPGDLILPQLNDCDGGRLTWFAFHPLDAAPALFAASDRWPDLASAVKERVARGYALWMTGYITDSDYLKNANSDQEKGADDSIVAPAFTLGISGEEVIHGRCDSGIITHSNSEGDFLLVRAGEFGYMDAGHSHDAPTAFTLYFKGKPLVVDSGTGAYTQSQEIRNQFRAARGKNVLLINGSGPSEPEGWFTWQRKTDVKLMSARRFEGGFYLKARHNGFDSVCGCKVEISREVIYLDTGLFIAIDVWDSEIEIEPSLVYTLHSDISIDSSKRRLFENDGAEFHFLIHDARALVDEDSSSSEVANESGDSNEAARSVLGQAVAVRCGYSPDYGVVGETGGLEISSEGSKSGAFISLFSRIGSVKRTARAGVYNVGVGELVRELKVGVSGKISLSSLKEGQRIREGVEFAR